MGNVINMAIAEAQAPEREAKSRLDDMLERYGEVCTRVAAARILGRCVRSVGTMLADGRLETACGGEMVDVRSIARYIMQPAREDFEARARKQREKRGTKWRV